MGITLGLDQEYARAVINLINDIAVAHPKVLRLLECEELDAGGAANGIVNLGAEQDVFWELSYLSTHYERSLGQLAEAFMTQKFSNFRKLKIASSARGGKLDIIDSPHLPKQPNALFPFPTRES